MLPVVIIGGIRFGVFTPTEAYPCRRRDRPEGPSGGKALLDRRDDGRVVGHRVRTEPDDVAGGVTRNFSKFHWTLPALPAASGVFFSSA